MSISDRALASDAAVVAANDLSEHRRIVRAALVLSGLAAAFGVVARWRVMVNGFDRPAGTTIYYRLYVLHELPFMLLLGAFVLLSFVLLYKTRGVEERSGPSLLLAPPRPMAVALIALAVFVAGLAITHLVMHELLFSMDEFTADFQARVFARGEYAPLLPWPWRSIGVALAPIFVHFHADSGRWSSQYLPVYSLMKSGFVLLGLGTALNPLLSAGAVVAVAAVARRLWPDDALRSWTAIALLATSSQLLVTAGTGYSMPAHLFLNLVWLWLYLRDDTRSWAAALLVGVLCMGLHNPFPHTLFVAPFMLRLLRDRRWARLGSAAVVYVAGAGVWLTWLRFADPVASGAKTGLLALFTFPDRWALWLHLMNVSLLFSWQAPVLGILVLLAIARPTRLEAPLVDLVLGVVATVGFFVFYPSTQGHGWGYRYAFPVLGNLCLLAAAGVPTIVEVLGQRRAQRWLALGVGLALIVQIPLRLRDTARFVRPFAAGYEYVRSRPTAVVIVHGNAIWYGQDLLRNDPFLEHPIVVAGRMLTPDAIEELKRALNGQVTEIDDRELLRLGMTPIGGR